MAQANGKEQSRRKRRGVAQLQNPAHIDRTNSGKRVCERSRDRYRGIGKGGGSRKPVCAGNVKTDRYGNRLGAERHSPK